MSELEFVLESIRERPHRPKKCMNKLEAILHSIREPPSPPKHTYSVQQCRELLKMYPKSYRSWLMLGIAYQPFDTEKAIVCLRESLQYRDNPTEALEELLRCVPTDEIPGIYGKILSYDPCRGNKFLKYHMRLAELGSCGPRLRPECIEILKKERLMARTYDRWISAERCLEKIWCSQDKIGETDYRLFATCMKTISADESNLACQVQCYKRYLEILNDWGEYGRLVVKADEMFHQASEKICALEWICRIYYEHYVTNPSVLNDLPQPIDFYVEELSKLKPDSSLILAIKYMVKEDIRIENEHESIQQLPPVTHMEKPYTAEDVPENLGFKKDDTDFNEISTKRKLSVETVKSQHIEKYYRADVEQFPENLHPTSFGTDVNRTHQLSPETIVRKSCRAEEVPANLLLKEEGTDFSKTSTKRKLIPETITSQQVGKYYKADVEQIVETLGRMQDAKSFGTPRVETNIEKSHRTDEALENLALKKVGTSVHTGFDKDYPPTTQKSTPETNVGASGDDEVTENLVLNGDTKSFGTDFGTSQQFSSETNVGAYYESEAGQIQENLLPQEPSTSYANDFSKAGPSSEGFISDGDSDTDSSYDDSDEMTHIQEEQAYYAPPQYQTTFESHTQQNYYKRDDLRLAIKDFKNLSVKFSPEACTLIHQALTKSIMRYPGREYLKFGRNLFNRGVVIISCKNEATYEFVIKVVPTFQVWDGAILKAVPAKKQKPERGYIVLPDLGPNKHDILKILQIQNPFVTMDGWSLRNEQRSVDGYKAFTVLMKEIPDLLDTEGHMTLCYGPGHVALWLIRKEDYLNDLPYY